VRAVPATQHDGRVDLFLFDPAGLIMSLVGLGLLVLKGWALVDCLTRPKAAFEVHGKLSKPAWLAILALAVLLNGNVLGIFGMVGTVAAIVYLVDVRPAVSGKAL
jgi:hypothetical protein